MVRQDFGALLQCLVRGQAAVGEDFKHQFVVVGALPDTRSLDRVPHAGNRRKDGIDRDHADGLIRFLVGVARKEAAAHHNLHHHVDLLFLVGGADDLFLVDHLQARRQFQVAGGDFALGGDAQANFLGFTAGVAKLDFLEVQDDVGDVLDDPRHGGELVIRPLYLHRGDGRSLERGQKHPPEAVAYGVAVAGFKRLRLVLGEGAGRIVRLLQLVWFLEMTQSYWHMFFIFNIHGLFSFPLLV